MKSFYTHMPMDADNEVIMNIKKYAWTKWLERPFSPFIVSFLGNISKEDYAKIGLPEVEIKAVILQKKFWYYSRKVFQESAEQLAPLLRKKSIFKITAEYEKFCAKSRERIAQLVKSNGNILNSFSEIVMIIRTIGTYLWLTHILEDIYNNKLATEVPKYVKKNADKFISAASHPSKQNAHSLMEQEILSGVDPKLIAKKYSWIRPRYLFTRGFNADDIVNIRKTLKPMEKPAKIAIPSKLQQLFKEVQELVWFRTARTDVFYEFIFMARPIFRKIAKYYGIPFNKLKNYTVDSLLNGKPKSYSENYTFASYDGREVFSEAPIIPEEKFESADKATGMTAFGGKVKGTVKVIKSVLELDKVKEGDILVTQMTFPSFISAMSRAKAFVTDEGGITCHAAIVAREMKKPCVIGTKKATTIFNDGDIVEVDADKGIVSMLRCKR